MAGADSGAARSGADQPIIFRVQWRGSKYELVCAALLEEAVLQIQLGFVFSDIMLLHTDFVFSDIMLLHTKV